MAERNYASDSLYTTKEQFLVVLDSRNATSIQNSPYNSQVRFDFEQPLELPRDALNITCSVLNFTAPNSIYNINETNNYFHLQFTVIEIPFPFGDAGFKVPVGNYTSTTLMAYIIQAMAVYGGGVTPTFGQTFSMSINPITNQFTFNNSSYLFRYMADSTISNVLGFSFGQTYYSSTITTGANNNNQLVAPYTCNFNGVQNINIHLDTCITNNVSSFSKSKSSIIANIPVDTNQANIWFVKNNDFCFSLKDDVIDYMAISIQDDLGNKINFNNQHWNMSLCFSVFRDVQRFSYENTFYNILKQGYHY